MIARVALLLALSSAALGAQAVRGRVLQPVSTAPAAGVLIAVSDARESEFARVMSNERGEFLLALPGAGRFDLRALRVGYRQSPPRRSRMTTLRRAAWCGVVCGLIVVWTR